MPDNDGQQTGTATGAQGDQGGQQSGSGSQQSGTPSGQQTSQQTGQQASSANQGASGFTYAEDRSRWIPPHRLSEESSRRQALERDLQAANDRIKALAGVQTQSPDATKQQQIVDAFLALPGMDRMRRFMEMTEDDFEALFEAPNTVRQTAQMTEAQWKRHGDNSVSTLATSVAEALGAESLDTDQMDDLRSSFSSWLKARVRQDLQTQGTSDPGTSQTLQRYEAGDPKLLEEFVKRYTKNWVQPASRQAAARNTNRTRPVPNSAGRSQVTAGPKRPDSFKTLDERLDYAAGVLRDQGMFSR